MVEQNHLSNSATTMFSLAFSIPKNIEVTSVYSDIVPVKHENVAQSLYVLYMCKSYGRLTMSLRQNVSLHSIPYVY